MKELFCDLGILGAYFAVLAAVALTLRKLIRIPDELFRKLLHFILLGSFPLFAFVFDTWWISVAVAVAFAVAVYPILWLFERLRAYSKFVTERKKGELKTSLLLVFGMFAAVIAVCCGWMGDPYLAVASVFAWGVGDAFAALVGKRFGRHKIKAKGTDGHKSAEGSGTMFGVSFLCVAGVLALRGGLDLWQIALTALVTAAVSTAIELFSKGGTDTVFCPLGAMTVLTGAVWIFGGVA